MINFSLSGLLLNSAIVIAVAVFLVEFWGKIVTDQTPFCDDRKFNTELFGISFILNNSFLSFKNLFLIGIFYIFKGFFGGHIFVWISSISLFLISPYIILRTSMSFLKIDYFGKIIIQIKAVLESKKIVSPLIKDGISGLESTNRFFSRKLTEIEVSIFSSLTLFFSIIFFFSRVGEIPRIIVLLIVFAAYTYIALAMSFINGKYLEVNLYFKSGEIIEGCKLIKVNDDNLKFIHEGKITVINKDTFLKFVVIKVIPAEFIHTPTQL